MTNPETNILVIDDEEAIVELLRDYFMELGFGVSVAYSAEEALSIITNGSSLHLVLSDINLPGKSGLDLLKIVKETKKNLPVVLLTGLRTLDNAIAAVKNGASDYITKPFELQTVKSVVEKILKKQRRIIKKDQLFENLQHIKLTYKFTSAELDPGILARNICEYIQKMQFSSAEEITNFELVFTEILVNAIDHGNLELSSVEKDNDNLDASNYEQLKKERLNDPAFGGRRLIINFEANDELFSFTVADEGGGYDWKKYVDHSHKIKTQLDEVYGRGFKIIQHYMDEIHLNDKGNIITVIKNRID
jgi:DNA-binding response OmpR family regulator